jgi:hypothetical protein
MGEGSRGTEGKNVDKKNWLIGFLPKTAMTMENVILWALSRSTDEAITHADLLSAIEAAGYSTTNTITFNLKLKDMINEGLIERPVRGLYNITPAGRERAVETAEFPEHPPQTPAQAQKEADVFLNMADEMWSKLHFKFHSESPRKDCPFCQANLPKPIPQEPKESRLIGFVSKIAKYENHAIFMDDNHIFFPESVWKMKVESESRDEPEKTFEDYLTETYLVETVHKSTLMDPETRKPIRGYNVKFDNSETVKKELENLAIPISQAEQVPLSELFKSKELAEKLPEPPIEEAPETTRDIKTMDKKEVARRTDTLLDEMKDATSERKKQIEMTLRELNAMKKNWILKMAEAKYSKDTKKVLETIRYKISKGVDPQIAFKDACVESKLDGMDQARVEKRMDIAAILWDSDQLDLDPIKIDRRPGPSPEASPEL